MNINSKEFKQKHKEMIKYGFCRECISILTSPWTIGIECEKCSKLIKKMNEQLNKKEKKL